MIARIWRCRAPRAGAAAVAAHILRTGVAECATVAGYRGAQLLCDQDTDPARFTLLTYWHDEESVRRFAGDDPSRAVLYAGDALLGIESNAAVTHHVVLHADLPGTGDAHAQP
jgi:heme-degrading monooxygenase HmoA